MEEYHRILALAYDKHIRSKVFLEGDLVLKSVDAVMRKMSLPKWAPKWEDPYIVSKVHPNGHCILLDPDHGTTTGPVNFNVLCPKKNSQLLKKTEDLDGGSDSSDDTALCKKCPSRDDEEHLSPTLPGVLSPYVSLQIQLEGIFCTLKDCMGLMIVY
ncbi:hypothetical protein Ahy_B03g063044 [Arachis hypogaea]|uniref:Uncharacterized protein n=1 Tax=Arachis hypogaea TaxID=3818 RepID=A0A444ZW14_ARAHY|nr:hypothetical protein Ahy_B03g063044 [Arachis hypogaea]